MKGRFDVGVLGATGIVGQEIITALVGHPWFQVTWIGASERSVGKRYAAATPWRLAASRPEDVSEIVSFLLSPKSSYINGANIPVTGGSRMPI